MQTNNSSQDKVKAVELIRAFQKYVESNPNNRHNRYLSFYWEKRLITRLGNMAWNEVEKYQQQISEYLREYGSKKANKKLADRTIELAWIGLAYSYEFGVVKKMIPSNPFSHLLPKNPKTGSYID